MTTTRVVTPASLIGHGDEAIDGLRNARLGDLLHQLFFVDVTVQPVRADQEPVPDVEVEGHRIDEDVREHTERACNHVLAGDVCDRHPFGGLLRRERVVLRDG